MLDRMQALFKPLQTRHKKKLMKRRKPQKKLKNTQIEQAKQKLRAIKIRPKQKLKPQKMLKIKQNKLRMKLKILLNLQVKRPRLKELKMLQKQLKKRLQMHKQKLITLKRKRTI